jgi:hypothetical protein
MSPNHMVSLYKFASLSFAIDVNSTLSNPEDITATSFFILYSS